MTMPVTRVVLRALARPDSADELQAVLTELAEHSRREAGCNGYKVFRSQSDPLEFVCYESWASDAALATHMTAAHVAEALAKGLPLLAEPPDRRVYTTVF